MTKTFITLCDITRFLTSYYVDVTKCFPDTEYTHIHHQTVLNRILTGLTVLWLNRILYHMLSSPCKISWIQSLLLCSYIEGIIGINGNQDFKKNTSKWYTIHNCDVGIHRPLLKLIANCMCKSRLPTANACPRATSTD